MTFRVEVVCLHDGGEQRCSVVEMERAELALETLGMSLAEGKAILHGIQDFMATAWLQGARTSPEMLYLKTKWASLIPFEKVVDLLKEVLPVAGATHAQTVREHWQR
jgi:hypothetical protein